ncbi:MAG: protein kinase [Sandaracinaceae bacterium]
MKICPQCSLKYPDAEERCFVDKTPLKPMDDPRIGAVLKGRYEIEAPLGEGGMAVVYRARNTLVERPVAVKVMNSNLKGDEALRERFRREAKNAAAVAHPNIVDIHDYGEMDDGTPFLVMELLEGETLNKVIDRGPIPPMRVVTLGVQVARGLARAHDFDVIHRDLKPENIFLADTDGPPLVKLLDFGIARSMHDSRLTNAGEIFGTPQYMAPERVTSLDAGAPADLYSLGCILFEMTTGRLPFRSEDIPGYFIQHMRDTPPVPSELVDDLPPPLEAIILQLLEKKPEDRPVDAHAVVKELEVLAPEGTVEARESAPSLTTVQKATSAPRTLPPATLERWAHRAALFEQMLDRAFPEGSAPDDQVQALETIRGVLKEMREVRAAGLEEQRMLEAMEANATETRERLGHAVHVLGVDLSEAREAARQAHKDVQPYLDADEAAREAYEDAHRRYVGERGAEPLERPARAHVEAARALAVALDHWSKTVGQAEKARTWLAAKDREVTDLQFQVDALRKGLDGVETTYEEEREATEDALRVHSERIGDLERRLVDLGGVFVEPLREHEALGDLFDRLETEGAPAVGSAPLSSAS